VGGSDAAFPAYELREAADPTHVLARRTFGLVGENVVEVAAAHEGPAIVAVTNGGLYVLTADSARLLARSEGLRSVDVTPSGDYAITVDDGGNVAVWSTTTGDELAHVTIANAIGVRIDALGTRAVVGASDALLHVMACR